MSAAVLDRSRVEIKLAGYGVAPAAALADSLLHLKVQDYRRAASSRLYPLEGREIAERIPAADFHVSRKMDGEFTVLILRDGEVFTLNPGGTVRVGLPLLDEAARLFSKAGVKEAMIAGELYQARDDRRPRVQDVVSTVGRPTAEDDLGKLRFAAFDVVSLGGAPPPAPFRDVQRRLGELFGSGTLVHVVEGEWVNKPAAVSDLYARWVETEGAEGLVARSDNSGSFKIKPRHNLDVAVIGFSESTGDRAGLLHDMLVAVLRREGTFHVLGKVGGGFSDDQRKAMLSDLKDMSVDSEYAEVNSDHVAYQMVRPEWVVEISCLDLITQSTRGGSVNRMVLDWHANNGHSLYRTLRRMPLAGVISPQFVRRREDKQVQPLDVRLAQLAELVELPLAEKDSRKLVLPKSEILRREVYVKELKGEQMVRKLLLWKTNKDQHAEDFPAYVVHLTDFSPNRKDALSREVRISSSFAQIQQLFDQLKTENITKGWNPYGAPLQAAPSQAAAVPAPILTAPAEVTASPTPNVTAPLAPNIAVPTVAAESVEVAASTAVAEPAAAESAPATKKKGPRKFVAGETELPAPAETPRKKKPR